MNNTLFQLAERPPGDMASLLATFKHISPVIRRQAKDLLNTIQDAMREYRKAVSTVEVTDQTADNDVIPPAKDMEMGVAVENEVETKESGTNDVLNSRLWSSLSVIPSAASSSLFGSTFGSTLNTTIASKVYTASTSVLFSNNNASVCF